MKESVKGKNEKMLPVIVHSVETVIYEDEWEVPESVLAQAVNSSKSLLDYIEHDPSFEPNHVVDNYIEIERVITKPE